MGMKMNKGLKKMIDQDKGTDEKRTGQIRCIFTEITELSMATDEPVKYADKSLKEDRAENSIIKPMNKCYAGYLHLSGEIEVHEMQNDAVLERKPPLYLGCKIKFHYCKSC
jgi:hypothetical protein